MRINNIEEINFYKYFSRTEYGKKLNKKIRFERYKPEKKSNIKWIECLGPDVNNLRHALVTHDLAKCFLNCHKRGKSSVRYTKQEYFLILLAAIIHDWAEVLVNDVSFDYKSRSGQKKEMIVLKKICAKISNEFKNGVLNNNIFLAIDKVMVGSDEKLFKTFNAIERLGYLQTAITAWNRAEEYSEISKNLKWLSSNVLGSQIPTLLEYRRLFPFVDSFLNKQRKKISEMFVEMPEDIFNFYESAKKITHNKGKFNKSQECWLNTL